MSVLYNLQVLNLSKKIVCYKDTNCQEFVLPGITWLQTNRNLLVPVWDRLDN